MKQDPIEAAIHRYFQARRQADEALVALLVEIRADMRRGAPADREKPGQSVNVGAEAQLPMLLRIEEAAKQLSISSSKLYQMIAAGEIPHVRMRNSLRISSQELAEWIARGGSEQ